MHVPTRDGAAAFDTAQIEVRLSRRAIGVVSSDQSASGRELEAAAVECDKLRHRGASVAARGASVLDLQNEPGGGRFVGVQQILDQLVVDLRSAGYLHAYPKNE